MLRPSHASVDESAGTLKLAGQDSTIAGGGDVLMRTAAAASVHLQSGSSASFSAQATVLVGNLVLGTRSDSPVTLGGAASPGSAPDLLLVGQSTTSGAGGDLVLSAGPSATGGQTGGSVSIDADTNLAGSLPAEVQVATASVCLSSCLIFSLAFTQKYAAPASPDTNIPGVGIGASHGRRRRGRCEHSW